MGKSFFHNVLASEHDETISHTKYKPYMHKQYIYCQHFKCCVHLCPFHKNYRLKNDTYKNCRVGVCLQHLELPLPAINSSTTLIGQSRQSMPFREWERPIPSLVPTTIFLT